MIFSFYPMTRNTTIGLGLFTIGLLVLTLFLSFSAKGASDDYKALIVVSSYNGTDEYEFEKAVAFYHYLRNNGYSNENIIFLTDEDFINKNGDASTYEIELAFKELASESKQKTEVCVYISDNSHATDGASYYEFDDGNISCRSIVDWIDDMKFDNLNYITLGNHSGLFGPLLSGEDRVIMSSMREYEETFTDYFNITRSLENPSADTNFDGEVSFTEAFYREKQLLDEYWEQNPEIWLP